MISPLISQDDPKAQCAARLGVRIEGSPGIYGEEDDGADPSHAMETNSQKKLRELFGCQVGNNANVNKLSMQTRYDGRDDLN